MERKKTQQLKGVQMKVAFFILRIFSVFSKITSFFIDRYYGFHHEYLKMVMKRCGKGVKLHGKIVITNPREVEIGDNVHIGGNAYIHSEGGLKIGNNTHISRNLVLYTVNHNYEGERLPYDEKLIKKKVEIGENVWIGMNVKIIPGITIGEGAIIGMGTVVSRDVPPLAIVGSSPQRIIKYRDKKRYHELKNKRKFGGVNGRPLDEK